MDTKRMQVLNSEYEPLRTHTRNMVKALTSSGFECEWGYFAQHSVRNGDEWFFEHYPIPVITVKNVCEIGFDLDQTFIECKLKRDAAIVFDFTRFYGFTFEVYGLTDYLHDFYNADQDIKDIHAKINKSDEKEIGVSLLFGYLESVEDIIQTVKKLKELLNAELA
jgi:hypothetical protein